ncbi:ATP-binding protein [Caulobacter sp. NIBR1757]|uniref:AAA family ATPase n=1 Tax=Caulobacter sp. NIBR1757 TaxID=3016000 RepID=UPI0022F03282|nr:ATP-binding protein [Caulobacter sp. NIBR1757]WGM37669.1 hypothetical protein AMEJIAPC_00568 [Caulobacter sp. NIBR1757]
MTPVAEGLETPMESAQVYAALSGPFEPLDALPEGLAANPGEVAMVASRLAVECDTSPPGTGGHWLMRTTERIAVLRSLSMAGQLTAAIARRRDQPLGDDARDLLNALQGLGPFSREAVQAAVSGPTPRRLLERIVVALNWAGEFAPAKDLLFAARSAISQLDRRERLDKVDERGFYGRDQERLAIATWLDKPFTAPPVRCLFITGAPGIGKSSLMAKAVREFSTGCDPLILRLDFDRAGLEATDRVGLTMEAARQVAEQLTTGSSELMTARLEAAATDGGGESASRRGVTPLDLARKIGEVATASGRPALVVLDTLEVLRGRGETHPRALFDWLDDLLTAGFPPLRVIASGRGDALDSCKDRFETPLTLPGLEDQAARAFLKRLDVPPGAVSDILAIADGSPLKLRLAAEIVRRLGAANLPRRKGGKAVEAAFLYRFLLSRIDDPMLKKLAHPGLVVRRLSPAVILEVLAPALGLKGMTEATATRLFDELTSHHWLVDPHPDAAGFIKHRSDMRGLLLPLLYRTSPSQCARIDEAAARWFAARGPGWEAEAAYHRLQLMRTRPAPVTLAPEVASLIDEEMLSELPDEARVLVLQAGGRRTEAFRASGVQMGDDTALAREVQALIERQDWQEGQDVINRVLEARALDPLSDAADAVRAFLWRAGRWAEARRWLNERDLLAEGDADLKAMPPVLALARLEMRAEFSPRMLRPALKAHGAPEALVEAAVAASDNGARHGTVAFLLRPSTNDWPYLRAPSREDVDVVAAAWSLWIDDHFASEAEMAVSLGRQRILNRLPSFDVRGHARLLAVLNPYAALAANLALADGHGGLLDQARAAVAGVLRTPSLSGPNAAMKSGHPITDLADIGLFAEWAQAAAFLRRDPDLRLIARAAERWRRTMAGTWGYTATPARWRGRPRPDETMRERTGQLLAESDLRWACLAQLEAWNPEGEYGRPVLDTLLGRLTLPRPDAADGPETMVALLLRRGVPSAFAPALAVMICNNLMEV